MPKRGRPCWALGVLILIALISACGATTPTAKPTQSTTGAQPTTSTNGTSATPAGATTPAGETWSKDDVLKATGLEQCAPLARLPKSFSKPWRLGFINPNKGYPFFADWSRAMNDAKAFYGIELFEVDSAGDYKVQLDLLETLLLNKPDLIGSHGPDLYEAIAARAVEIGIPYIGIDNGPSELTPVVYGIPDKVAGKRSAELLTKGCTERSADEWKDRELFFIEFTHSGVPACVTRTGAAATLFKENMKLDDDHVLKGDAATGRTATDMMNEILTAHPEAVFGMIPCWDALGIEAYNAAVQAKRDEDVMLVTIGGDKPAAEFLLTKPTGYYGYIESQPYCEGWGWVEAALATLEGMPFETYQVRRATTQAEIEQRFKDLYGAASPPTAAPTAAP